MLLKTIISNGDYKTPKNLKQKTLSVQYVFLFILFFIWAFAYSQKVSADDQHLPFRPGEKLTMNVKWGVIPAGQATLEVLPHKEINGVKTNHFVLTVRTTPFIDFFYKVRDKIDSYTDMKMSRSILYMKQKRGRGKKDIVVKFDWEKKEARYSNLRRKGKRRNRKPVPIPPGTYDPMSVFYAFRLQDLEQGKELECPVTDGKKCVIGKAKVIKREKIIIAGQTFDTYLVKPDLEHLEGIFEKSKNASLKVWVTADKRKIPVRIESEVIVGSFIGELESIENDGKVELILKESKK
ncbi:DUF3108 domain-containing protein [Thermodesulfobacteriota bacterium]